MTIQKRLEKINKAAKLTVPGNSIVECMHETHGYVWVVGIGNAWMPKNFFTARTIEGALRKAENHFIKKGRSVSSNNQCYTPLAV